MSIIVKKESRRVVQGFTGSEGTFHAEQMIEYGTNVVGGVTPGKGGQVHLGKPVFNTVSEAVNIAKANTSIIFVPSGFAADAIMEAADAGLKTIIAITEGIPVSDMTKVNHYLKNKVFPRIIIINDTIYISAKNLSKAREVEDVFRAHLEILLRNPEKSLVELTTKEVNFL